MVYLDVCSMGTGKECVFFRWVEQSIDLILLVDGVKFFYVLAGFLSSSPIMKREVLESSRVKCGYATLSIQLAFASHVLQLCRLVNTYLGLCLLGGLSLSSLLMSFSGPGNFLCS